MVFQRIITNQLLVIFTDINMVEIFKGNWTLNDVSKNRNKIFVFGDNNLGFGKGGQAIIRDQRNAIGLRTKKAPNNDLKSFYTDKEYDDNIYRIGQDIKKIKNLEDKGHIIVFSNGGYGTGLARLKQKEPLTFKYLCDELKNNFDYENDI